MSSLTTRLGFSKLNCDLKRVRAVLKLDVLKVSLLLPDHLRPLARRLGGDLCDLNNKLDHNRYRFTENRNNIDVVLLSLFNFSKIRCNLRNSSFGKSELSASVENVVLVQLVASEP